MFTKKISDASPGSEVLSYNFEIDEKLSAFILRNRSKRKSFLNFSSLSKIQHEEKSIIWINNPQYRFDIVPLEVYNKLFLKDIPIFISSCSDDLVPFFNKNKFETLKIGREALLEADSEHFSKKSLKELIKAGLKTGRVEEIYYSEENAKKLEEFKVHCVHGHEPQWKYFFNDIFLPTSRFFVYKDRRDIWQGGITIAQKEDGKVFTELILRRQNSPRGTMEALVFSIFEVLKKQNFKTWSLGEVPYIVYDSKIFSKEFFINYLGRRVRFAYNYLGLYNFKNKFSPKWRDVYICCKPELNLSTLIRILWRSNLLKLVLTKPVLKLRASIKKPGT